MVVALFFRLPEDMGVKVREGGRNLKRIERFIHLAATMASEPVDANDKESGPSRSKAGICGAGIPVCFAKVHIKLSCSICT